MIIRREIGHVTRLTCIVEQKIVQLLAGTLTLNSRCSSDFFICILVARFLLNDYFS